MVALVFSILTVLVLLIRGMNVTIGNSRITLALVFAIITVIALVIGR